MSASPSGLPARPSLEQLRKQAKERLSSLREADQSAKLAEAQFQLAHEYGFENWAQLVAHVSALDPREAVPRITSPVSRHLGTSDVARATAFWRDVLGFDVRGSHDTGVTDLVSGAARVRLGTRDWAPDFSDEGRAPGSAIVFFETDNAEALRSAITERGGHPSPLENVNWIKMRVFEVRDPDGHALWFGQSYHVDSPEAPKPMVQKVMPELPLADVPAGVRHYRDVLGFSVNYAQDDIGVMDRDEARVLLITRTSSHSGIGSAYFYVRDADALYTELLGRGADLQSTPISQPWGLREFSVLDLERNRLTFGQTFE
jgi:catechol 2,3-dioxygenase-like lactoylglutathione lyase family enzyme